MTVSAMMAALALVLPPVFHAAGLGSRFLPMLLPLLLNGFFVPLRWAVLTGAVVPLLSALLTGMPPLYPPLAGILAVEGAVLGGTAALLYRGRRLWLAVIGAIVLGRLSAFGLSWALAGMFGLPPALAGVALLVQGLPGVALQLAVIPVVVRAARQRATLLFEDTR